MTEAQKPTEEEVQLKAAYQAKRQHEDSLARISQAAQRATNIGLNELHVADYVVEPPKPMSVEDCTDFQAELERDRLKRQDSGRDRQEECCRCGESHVQNGQDDLLTELPQFVCPACRRKIPPEILIACGQVDPMADGNRHFEVIAANYEVTIDFNGATICGDWVRLRMLDVDAGPALDFDFVSIRLADICQVWQERWEEL
jgi:hypothetical protein